MQPSQEKINPAATLRDVWQLINRHYPFELAEEWDSCGVIVGDWEQPVGRILLSADITKAVIDYAIEHSFDLVISHHPLWLRRHTPNNAPYKLEAALVARLGGVSLLNAHTNADISKPGVSDAIADLLDLQNVKPLVTLPQHEELGIGRVGELPTPISLATLAENLKTSLQDSSLRYAGRVDQKISRVGLVGGAGDSYLPDAVAAGCDVFITSDLRHHPLQEHLESGGCAVIDINHALAESLWLNTLAEHLIQFEVEVSPLDTRGWN